MPKLSCSIIMPTYNGGKYLLNQLNSFEKQTRQPDEIIICDDCSTDDTKKIIEDFIKKSRLNIKFFSNIENVGFNKNFVNAFKKSSCDIVFFSDQDDIWHFNKIELVMTYFESKFEMIGITTNKKNFVDSDEGNILNLAEKPINDSNLQNIDLKQMVKYFNCSGLTFAVKRKNYLDLIDLVTNCGNGYDTIAGIVFSSTGQLYHLNKCLVFHRIHESNATGTGKRNKDFALKSLNRKVGWLESANILVENNSQKNEFKRYVKVINFYKKLISLYNNKKKFRFIIKSIFPPRWVRLSYSLSNIYYIFLKK